MIVTFIILIVFGAGYFTIIRWYEQRALTLKLGGVLMLVGAIGNAFLHQWIWVLVALAILFLCCGAIYVKEGRRGKTP